MVEPIHFRRRGSLSRRTLPELAAETQHPSHLGFRLSDVVAIIVPAGGVIGTRLCPLPVYVPVGDKHHLLLRRLLLRPWGLVARYDFSTRPTDDLVV